FQPNLGGGVCDFFGGPCGDAFVAKVTAGGPGAVFPTTLSVTPTELGPGGTVTATWAGIPIPTAGDYLILYGLGSGGETYVAYWPTGGAGAGTLTLTFPANLPFGSYELRLLSPDPNFNGLLEPVARSRPIYVGEPAAAATDLVIGGITTTP